MTNIEANALAKTLFKALDLPPNYHGPRGPDRWRQRLENIIKGHLAKRSPRRSRRAREPHQSPHHVEE